MPAPPKRRRVVDNPDNIARVRKLLRQGETTAHIANELGISTASVYEIQKRNNLKKTPKKYPEQNPKIVTQARKLAKQGYSQLQAAQKLGLSDMDMVRVSAAGEIRFPPKPITAEIIEQAKQLAGNGVYLTQAARQLGLTTHALGKLEKEHGIAFARSTRGVPAHVKEEVIALAKRGHTSTQISQETGISAPRVRAIAAEAGVPLLPATMGAPPRITQTQTEQILKLALQFHTVREISEQTGVTRSTVQRTLDRHDPYANPPKEFVDKLRKTAHGGKTLTEVSQALGIRNRKALQRIADDNDIWLTTPRPKQKLTRQQKKQIGDLPKQKWISAAEIARQIRVPVKLVEGELYQHGEGA